MPTLGFNIPQEVAPCTSGVWDADRGWWREQTCCPGPTAAWQAGECCWAATSLTLDRTDSSHDSASARERAASSWGFLDGAGRRGLQKIAGGGVWVLTRGLPAGHGAFQLLPQASREPLEEASCLRFEGRAQE